MWILPCRRARVPETLREDISFWQLMAFTVAKLRSFIREWSGVSSRHENNLVGVRPRASRATKTTVYGPRPQQVKDLSTQRGPRSSHMRSLDGSSSSAIDKSCCKSALLGNHKKRCGVQVWAAVTTWCATVMSSEAPQSDSIRSIEAISSSETERMRS